MNEIPPRYGTEGFSLRGEGQRSFKMKRTSSDLREFLSSLSLALVCSTLSPPLSSHPTLALPKSLAARKSSLRFGSGVRSINLGRRHLSGAHAAIAFPVNFEILEIGLVNFVFVN